MLVSMRFSLPDRPGTLGSVATALSHTGASIVQLVVVDVDEGYAVDEVCLEVDPSCPVERLRRAAEAIPGVVVEATRGVERPPDPLAALGLADELGRNDILPLQTLVKGLPNALFSAWAMAIEANGGVHVLAASPGAPTPGVMETPFLPLSGARRLSPAQWMPPRWRASNLELAAAPLLGPGGCVLVGRRSGMPYRATELRQLELLAGMATRAAAPV